MTKKKVKVSLVPQWPEPVDFDIHLNDWRGNIPAEAAMLVRTVHGLPAWRGANGFEQACIATASGPIVGYAALYANVMGAGSLRLGNLSVMEGVRRYGIGLAIVRRLCGYARSVRLDVEAEVLKDNKAARALFEKAGFRLAAKQHFALTTITLEWRRR